MTMYIESLSKILPAFFIVISIILLISLLIRRFSNINHSSGNKQINLIETRFIDNNRKLLLFKVRDKNYLMLLSKQQDIVLDKWQIKCKQDDEISE